MTQLQLAKTLDVQPSTISSYETGALFPSIEKMMDICSYFQVSADYMMGLNGEQDLQLDRLTDDQNMAVSEIVKQYILLNEQLKNK